jgi:hypothetical protein
MHLVSEQHSESESECHDTPDAMQPRCTEMSSTRTSSHSAPPDMSSSDPSALEAARHASADLDQSASNTGAGCELVGALRQGAQVPAAHGTRCSRRSASPSTPKNSTAPVRA